MAEALNLLTVLAAPRLYAQWCTQAPPTALREALDARLLSLAAFCEQAKGSADAERFRAAASQVRALADNVLQTPSDSLPGTAWMHPSRQCLEALGFHAPPEGWDTFEGWPG